MPKALAVDSARCTHETVDGETLILDTLTGRLLILVGSGALVWDRLLTGADYEQLLAQIADTYDAEAAQKTGEFLDELVNEGLLVEVGEAPSPDATANQWPAEYVSPQIERYDEIAAIMTMDPIHDIDVTKGWPAAPATGD